MSTTFIEVTQNEAVLCIKMNRPEKKNALTLSMYASLTEALERAEEETSIRAVLLQGADEVFTSGNDIADFLQGNVLSGDTPVIKFLHKLVDFKKPLIAAVNGHAIGIGTTLLLHCDAVIAGENASFQMPFINLACCPEGGSSLLLPLAIGYQKAAHYLLLGKKFDAQEALAMQLILEVVSPDKTNETALKLASEYAAMAPEAMVASKSLLKKGYMEILHKVIDDEAQIFAQRLNSAEAKQAFSYFLSKKPPKN